MQHLLMLVFTFFLLRISAPARALETVYGAEGGDVVLTPPNGPALISRIEWQHGADIAAEWYGNETNCLTKFEGRCKLDHLTGALTITGLTKNDSGIYKPEINYVVSDSTELIVISHVPKPSVSESCDTEMTACNLTCEGNTIEAEPITYKWFLGDTEGPSGKVLDITKEMEEQSFSCMLVNPVGNKSSDSMKNPLLIAEKNRLASIIVPVVVGLLVLLAVIIGVIVFLKRKRKRRTGSFNTGAKNRGNQKESVKYHPAPTKDEANNDAGTVQSVSYRDLNAKEEVNHEAEVHVPPTQESKSLSNGSAVNSEVQEASNQASDSTPRQNGCSGAENTSVVVEMSDLNPTTPASPASSQETEPDHLLTDELTPADQEETPADEQEADDAGDLDEH